MSFFRQRKKKLGIIEILYQNIRLLREINKTRKERDLAKHFYETQSVHQFEDPRILMLFEKYQKRFRQRHLESVIAHLLKDMEICQFESSSSVPSIFETQHIRNKNRYDKLRTINLLSHTIRVFINALELPTNMPDRFMEQIALLSLAHDFGKNQKIYELASLDKNKEAHNHVSAAYLRIVMQMLEEYSDEFINSMCDSLYNHHFGNRIDKTATQTSLTNYKEDLSPMIKDNEFIKYLNICDQKARDDELKMLERKILEREAKKFKSWQGVE